MQHFAGDLKLTWASLQAGSRIQIYQTHYSTECVVHYEDRKVFSSNVQEPPSLRLVWRPMQVTTSQLQLPDDVAVVRQFENGFQTVSNSSAQTDKRVSRQFGLRGIADASAKSYMRSDSHWPLRIEIHVSVHHQPSCLQCMHSRSQQRE